MVIESRDRRAERSDEAIEQARPGRDAGAAPGHDVQHDVGFPTGDRHQSPVVGYGHNISHSKNAQ